MKDSGIMEYWEEVMVCFLVILHSAIRNLHSAIEAGGELMLWIMESPVRGQGMMDNER